MSFTPLHVEIARRLGQDTEQFYPELLWLMFILPLSGIILVAGAIGAWVMTAGRKQA